MVRDIADGEQHRRRPTRPRRWVVLWERRGPIAAATLQHTRNPAHRLAPASIIPMFSLAIRLSVAADRSRESRTASRLWEQPQPQWGRGARRAACIEDPRTPRRPTPSGRDQTPRGMAPCPIRCPLLNTTPKPCTTTMEQTTAALPLTAAGVLSQSSATSRRDEIRKSKILRCFHSKAMLVYRKTSSHPNDLFPFFLFLFFLSHRLLSACTAFRKILRLRPNTHVPHSVYSLTSHTPQRKYFFIFAAGNKPTIPPGGGWRVGRSGLVASRNWCLVGGVVQRKSAWLAWYCVNINKTPSFNLRMSQYL
jgi:hypothetical protein